MIRHHPPGARDAERLRGRERDGRSAYTLIVRGPDGRLREERFRDASSYRARLTLLQSDDAVSVGEIAALLDS